MIFTTIIIIIIIIIIITARIYKSSLPDVLKMYFCGTLIGTFSLGKLIKI